MADLLPCPHCGEREHLYPAYRLDKDGKYSGPAYSIDCLGCGADFTPRDGMDAIAAWNRRTANSSGVKVRGLEWHKSNMPFWNGDFHTVPTCYTVRSADENGWQWLGFGGRGYASSPEEAKAAAQQDYERRILSALVPASGVKVDGIARIASERRRQIDAEGWTPEHDAEHTNGELAIAAACYALNSASGNEGAESRHAGIDFWPWSDEWWKPSGDPIRDLEKAGALIAAEIDRLSRPTYLYEMDALSPAEAGVEGDAKPVAWQRRQLYSDIPGYVPQWQFVLKEGATGHFEKRPGYEYRPLYSDPVSPPVSVGEDAVERVAQAIVDADCGAEGLTFTELSRHMARAAIAAISHPSLLGECRERTRDALRVYANSLRGQYASRNEIADELDRLAASLTKLEAGHD